MEHEVLTAKLCELEDQFVRLRSRIHLSETADHEQLRREISILSKECAETELTLQKGMQLSKAKVAPTLAHAYGEIEQIIQKTKSELEKIVVGQNKADAVAEGKILLAEYSLDFAIQAANHALLVSLEAIDSQMNDQEKKEGGSYERSQNA